MSQAVATGMVLSVSSQRRFLARFAADAAALPAQRSDAALGAPKSCAMESGTHVFRVCRLGWLPAYPRTGFPSMLVPRIPG
eukprot:16064022-Heterocapsa_arctica.AAC.1